ncbi:MAG: histidine phosphatase family protein [Mycobacterium sp.]|nr:histidine phosphatase family protein [Mycobacterium sp.]
MGRMQRQIAHPPLTARGIAQAYAAGYQLQGKGVRRIVTSDAVRATQTAQAIATVTGAEPVVDSRLRERGWGDHQRPVSSQRSVPRRLEDPQPRICTLLADVMESSVPTVLVTHGDIVCATLDLLCARDATSRGWDTGSAVPNGAVICVRIDRRAASRVLGR